MACMMSTSRQRGHSSETARKLGLSGDLLQPGRLEQGTKLRLLVPTTLFTAARCQLRGGAGQQGCVEIQIVCENRSNP